MTSHVQSSARKGDKTKGKLACYTNPFSTSVHYDSNCLESLIAPVGYVAPKSNKSSVIIIPKFITDRLRRWDKVPKNESLSMGPLPLRPVRVVFVITADVSESEVTSIEKIKRRHASLPSLRTRWSCCPSTFVTSTRLQPSSPFPSQLSDSPSP